jgi:hypothetical protein
MRIINKAESWEKVYDAFEQINFSAFDYLTVKQSIIDYLRLYFPEDFNDWIESSELLPIIEAFAYVAELLAYRFDMNAHENILSVAQRKESVLRLAKLLSYNSSRNIPSRGLVKVSSISTTESVFDSLNTNLANKTIRWNDPNNARWKEQFILVIDSVLKQKFGSVTPSDRTQVQDVLFEVYTLDNTPITNNTISYDISVADISYPMELVGVELTAYGPEEVRPEKDLNMSILYLSDGLGDSSDNTGFFFFTKQGEIGRQLVDFDGVTPNQTYDVGIENCNETDVWVNRIYPDTGYIYNETDVRSESRPGEWKQVDVASAQNIIFNTESNRNKYEIETLDDDKFRLIFGDGNFANIPSGRFEIWYRVSANVEMSIPQNAIQNVANKINYLDVNNKEHAFTFNVSLVNSIQNSAPSEDIERIRRVAPARYYTQDRMVNGRDYNEFMLQDNSILKLRAINRTFSGDSKYIHWHDPKEYYENVKLFGNDLVLYFDSIDKSQFVNATDLPAQNDEWDTDGVYNGTTISALIDNYIEPILGTDLYFMTFTIVGVAPAYIRKTFTDDEYMELKLKIESIAAQNNDTCYMFYSAEDDLWTTLSSDNEIPDWWITVSSLSNDNWEINYRGKKTVAHSPTTKFWVTNGQDRVITTDTLNTNLDEIVLLGANKNTIGETIDEDNSFNVIRQMEIEVGEDAGTESVQYLEVIPVDANGDGVPDNSDLSYLFGSADWVYFHREDTNTPWSYIPGSEYPTDIPPDESALWKKENGIDRMNFLWMHRTPRYHLIDPASSNIIDVFIISRGYYTSVRQWLSGKIASKPTPPTPFTLRTDYNYMLNNKMISDTVVLHPGKIKVIFGSLAKDALQATIKVIKSQSYSLSSNQIKVKIVDIVNEFFDINRWEFGETFYFTELSSFIHTQLPVEIDSVILVPKYSSHVFGDLYQVLTKEDEIIQPNITVNDIEIIESINSSNSRRSS